jgi:hypothetical protein
MTRKLFRGAGVITMAALAASLALAGPASAAPPGNNGTIKIDGRLIDDLPNNQPHVGCLFEVEFFGFDPDTFADVTFEAQAPTPGDLTVFGQTHVDLGQNATPGGSANGFDVHQEYRLGVTELTAHPIQGYHIKLTIHAEGAKGADVKHKTFWVTGCDPCPPPTEDQPTT